MHDDTATLPRGNFDIKAQIAAYWDSRADSFDASPFHAIGPGPEEAAWQSLLRRHLPPVERPRVLELGCGTGVITLQLVKLGAEVTAVDLGERMLNRARAKAAKAGAAVTFIFGDAEDPFLAGGGFDAVISRHLIWTLPDPAAALGRWQQALKPSGRTLVIDHDGQPANPLKRAAKALASRLDTRARPTIHAADSVYQDLRRLLPYGVNGMPAGTVAVLMEAAGYSGLAVDAMAGVRLAQWRKAATLADRLRILSHQRYLVAGTRP